MPNLATPAQPFPGQNLDPESDPGQALVLFRLSELAEAFLAAVSRCVQHLIDLGITARHAGEVLSQEFHRPALVGFGPAG